MHRANTLTPSDALRQYLTQCRHEVGNRLAERVIDPATGKPSKVWSPALWLSDVVIIKPLCLQLSL
jgi:hypothetical protein